MDTGKKIYCTTDYSVFKRLKGNRSVPRSRVNSIKNSIISVGYITNPTIVNENMEVIDGQGRLEALRELSLPVEYIIHQGAGVEECRAMNIKQGNWNVRDYIESYAEDGNESYVMLLELTNKYKRLGICAIYNAITGLDSPDNNKIKLGKFNMSEGERDYADAMLSFETRFLPIIDRIKGRKDYVLMAVGYAYRNDTVDNDTLYDVLSDNSERFKPPATKFDALDELSRIYNKNVKPQKRIYLKTDYERELNNKYPWYDNKWLKPRKTENRIRHY